MPRSSHTHQTQAIGSRQQIELGNLIHVGIDIDLRVYRNLILAVAQSKQTASYDMDAIHIKLATL